MSKALNLCLTIRHRSRKVINRQSTRVTKRRPWVKLALPEFDLRQRLFAPTPRPRARKGAGLLRPGTHTGGPIRDDAFRAGGKLEQSGPSGIAGNDNNQDGPLALLRQRRPSIRGSTPNGRRKFVRADAPLQMTPRGAGLRSRAFLFAGDRHAGWHQNVVPADLP
jgi:hypothetical protein